MWSCRRHRGYAAAIGVVVLAAAVMAATRGSAAEVTRVARGVEPGGRLPDVNVSLAWGHEQKRALVKREVTSANTPTPALSKELIFRQSRDLLRLRVEAGIFRTLSFHFDLPFVVRDDRTLEFDQRDRESCLFPGEATVPTCVNEQNATVLRDGILPNEGDRSTYGIDARHGGGRFSRPSPTVFRGPRRSGIEALGLGLKWAVFTQERDRSKPTWTVGLDGRFDVGTAMRFDPANSGGNTGVGLGYHQVIASTYVSKRLGALEPYFGLAYVLPVVSDGGPFATAYGGHQPYAAPQRSVAAEVGVEHIAWERPERGQRIVLELRGRAEHLFRGRSRSELWEALSGSSRCPVDVAACRAGLDIDANGDGSPDPYPGISETQAYTRAGADVGLGIAFGRYARLRGLFGFASEVPHFITFATPGSGATVNTADRNAANPMYRPLIDLPGRRFKVDGTQLWTVFVDGALTF